MHVLQTIWEAFYAILGWIAQIVLAFGSYLGIGEWFAKCALMLIIIAILTTGPFGVSKKDKLTIKRITDVLVDTVTYLRR